MQSIGLTLVAALLLALPAAATDMLVRGPGNPTTHEVKMVQVGEAYRFQPASLTVRPGDRVRFVNVSGGPHNVAFDAGKIPDAAEKQLAANRPDPIAPLSGALLTKPGESYTVSFAGVPPGAYPFSCMPHLAMGMKGVVTVR